MDLIADGLLVAGALGAAFYCFILSNRLTRFTDLRNGMGAAVAVLSAQVDDLSRALAAARQAAEGSGADLSNLTDRAEAATRRLELHLAALHDLPQDAAPPIHGDGAEVHRPFDRPPMVAGFRTGRGGAA